MRDDKRLLDLDEAELTIAALEEENQELKEKVSKLRRQVIELTRELETVRAGAAAPRPGAERLRSASPRVTLDTDANTRVVTPEGREGAVRTPPTARHTPVQTSAPYQVPDSAPISPTPARPPAPSEGMGNPFHNLDDLPDFDLYVDMNSTQLGRPLTASEAKAQPALPPVEATAVPGFDIGYINAVSEEQLDQLPFGLIVLDEVGTVLVYNETESKLTGFRRERILGRNFFVDIAPCTRVKEFEGRFHAFVRGELGRVTFFEFAFHFTRGTQQVLIAFSHGRQRGQINIMMMRRKSA
jgi:photoactive yellow protein